MRQLTKHRVSILDLYKKVGNEFSEINEYLYALDALYILSVVNIDEKGWLSIVD